MMKRTLPKSALIKSKINSEASSYLHDVLLFLNESPPDVRQKPEVASLTKELGPEIERILKVLED